MRIDVRAAMALALALSCVAAAPARADDAAVANAKKLVEIASEYAGMDCPAKARAALEKAEKAVAALGEFEKEKVSHDLDSAKRSVERVSGEKKDEERYGARLGRMVDGCERTVESSKTSSVGEYGLHEFNNTIHKVEEMLSDDDNK